jgi:hypothetical protein
MLALWRAGCGENRTIERGNKGPALGGASVVALGRAPFGRLDLFI